jgi:hypothetical protein
VDSEGKVVSTQRTLVSAEQKSEVPKSKLKSIEFPAQFQNLTKASKFNNHYTEVVIHHAAYPSETSPRVVQQLHIIDRGWGDIGYHFVIAYNKSLKKWETYEARPLEYQGAHASAMNAERVGILIMGNFEPFDAVGNPSGYKTIEEGTPPDEAMIQLASLIQDLSNPESAVSKTYKERGIKIDVDRVIGHNQVTDPSTHRLAKATACPGLLMEGVVKACRELFAKDKNPPLILMPTPSKADSKGDKQP